MWFDPWEKHTAWGRAAVTAYGSAIQKCCMARERITNSMRSCNRMIVWTKQKFGGSPTSKQTQGHATRLKRAHGHVTRSRYTHGHIIRPEYTCIVTLPNWKAREWSTYPTYMHAHGHVTWLESTRIVTSLQCCCARKTRKGSLLSVFCFKFAVQNKKEELSARGCYHHSYNWSLKSTTKALLWTFLQFDSMKFAVQYKKQELSARGCYHHS